MCGIAGYVDFSSETNPLVIKKMTDEIVYRGPDSSGEYVSKDNIAGLGIRRLSIIDLKTGDQPIKNEDGSVIVVFNGEIYGYRHLREDLLKKGHKLKTKSDTEVLVHLYEEYGEDMPKFLNGMFAFAIWDENKQKLFLARDRAGIKPLYYSNFNGIFAFGSEPKTVLSHPKFSKTLNSAALLTYMYFGYLPTEISMFKNVFKLLPGSSLTLTKSGLKIKKYWRMAFDKFSDANLDELLDRAVTDQLIADVPVGVFLSGGLDSSLISYYITKHKRKMKSFSISFEQKSYNESDYSFAVAKHLGIEHYVEELKVTEIPILFNKISEKLDEPVADASLIPTYKVSEFARKHVTVALSGDGGDELFGGYPTYQAHIIADFFKYFPQRVLNMGIKMFSLLPVSYENYPLSHVGTTFLQGVKKEPLERQIFWMHTFFFDNGMPLKKPSLNFKKYLPNLDEFDPVKRAMIADFFTYLADDLLVKTDRASMFNSLEVRVPYLDNNLIDFAFSQDSRKHASLFETKKILRNLARRYLPKDVANRPKKGFGMPVGKWLREDLKDFGNDVLSYNNLYDFLDKRQVMNLWTKHQKGTENNGGAIWQLVMLSGWLKHFS